MRKNEQRWRDKVKARLRMLFWLMVILAVWVSSGWASTLLLELLRAQTEWPAGQAWYAPAGWWGWLVSLVTTPWSHETSVRLAGAVAGAVIFCMSVVAIFRARHGLLTSQARRLFPSDARERTVLVIGLSPKAAGAASIAAMGRLPLEESALTADQAVCRFSLRISILP